MEVGTIINGYIIIKDGKIFDVGKMDDIDKKIFKYDNVIDAKGMDAYPGFIDAHTHLGLFADGEGYECEDANEVSNSITPNMRVIDAINPMDKCFDEAIRAGITTVVVSPGSANPISGEISAIKTNGIRIDNMIIKNPIGIKFAMGENPRRVNGDSGDAPITRMAVASLIRETLYKATKYMNDKEKALRNEESYDMPDYDSKYESLIPLLKREIKAHFHAHRADDIFTSIRIANEFNLDYCIVHATEAHIIIEELLKEGTDLLIGPMIGDRSKPELKNMKTDAVVDISKSGLNSAIITDHPELPIQYLPLCASLAVGKGVPKYKAIEMITSGAARICNIYDKVGSIKIGKDADILLYSRDLFEMGIQPDVVIINGKVVKNKLI